MRGAALALIVVTLAITSPAFAQKTTVWTPEETPIHEAIRGLRKLPDDVRASTTRDLALKIRKLPATANKLTLAIALANLSTEGDFGRDNLQEVANTLAEALREQPQPDEDGGPAYGYRELARLVRYEHMQTNLDAPPLRTALSMYEADDRKRQDADFTLTDLQGKSWSLRDLKGKVVLVSFWATWCPPCRKEMPDLESLYLRFKDQGFLVLAISAEQENKVRPFIENEKYSYPVLLDPDGKVSERFVVEGIPHSFVFNRDGKLVAQSTDMRTRGQFLAMLGEAGIR
jgi:peroxiredoxin